MEELLQWINELNNKIFVKIEKVSLDSKSFWFYNSKEGVITNRNNSFFTIKGIKGVVDGEQIQQPIIIQDEIGYLGIICKDFDGITKYLMQAKIEPGNINCIQISPTIQATKSNFTQKHGGKAPLYLDYFKHASLYKIIVDQIQSEQSSRFYKKRNRNMIIKVNDEVKIKNDRFRWMTLLEIKELMKYKNLVNMDTRTVLSCLPLCSKDICLIDPLFDRINSHLEKSIHNNLYVDEVVNIYHKINDYKMFNANNVNIVGLDELDNWIVDDTGVRCKTAYPYEVIYCDIQIEGREVTRWVQPLFKANGIATFGLIRTIIESGYKYLVKISPEIGCFDSLEIGPSIQKEYGSEYNADNIELLFKSKMDLKQGVVFDSILSEEGGRFYHEENRNIIMDVDYKELVELPNNYFLLSYNALCHLNLINNCLNIQLRNLLSTLEVE